MIVPTNGAFEVTSDIRSLRGMTVDLSFVAVQDLNFISTGIVLDGMELSTVPEPNTLALAALSLFMLRIFYRKAR